MIVKELKLIARDPLLIAKSLVQGVALVPLMLLLVRKSQLAGLLGASLVLLASMLAGIFAWIAVSGEEAPDLLGSSPVDDDRLRWLKVAAALLPVGVLCTPFLAWYAYLSWRLFAIVVVFLTLSLASAGVIQVWTGVPGSGRDLRVRNRKNILANLVESMATFGWAGACYLAMAGCVPRGAARRVLRPARPRGRVVRRAARAAPSQRTNGFLPSFQRRHALGLSSAARSAMLKSTFSASRPAVRVPCCACVMMTAALWASAGSSGLSSASLAGSAWKAAHAVTSSEW